MLANLNVLFVKNLISSDKANKIKDLKRHKIISLIFREMLCGDPSMIAI